MRYETLFDPKDRYWKVRKVLDDGTEVVLQGTYEGCDQASMMADLLDAAHEERERRKRLLQGCGCHKEGCGCHKEGS